MKFREPEKSPKINKPKKVCDRQIIKTRPKKSRSTLRDWGHLHFTTHLMSGIMYTEPPSRELESILTLPLSVGILRLVGVIGEGIASRAYSWSGVNRSIVAAQA
jgi:hypothetical protein